MNYSYHILSFFLTFNHNTFILKEVNIIDYYNSNYFKKLEQFLLNNLYSHSCCQIELYQSLR